MPLWWVLLHLKRQQWRVQGLALPRWPGLLWWVQPHRVRRQWRVQELALPRWPERRL